MIRIINYDETMVKKCILQLLIFIIITSCAQNTSLLLEKQVKELGQLATQAGELKKSLGSKRGDPFLEDYEKYNAIMIQRVKKAARFLKPREAEKLTSQKDLINLAQIAEVSQNEQKLINILKIIFTRYPASKSDKGLLQMYFPNAYLLEPEKIENYVDLSLFSPNDELECYYALALGYVETGNQQGARVYLQKAETMLQELLSQKVQRSLVYKLRNAGLKSYIEYKLGRDSEALNTLNELKKQHFDEYSVKQLELFENRLKVLGQKAKPVEYQFWIGSEQALDLSELQGKVILLNFATWNCDACNQAIPSLFQLKKEINNDDFMILGVTQYTGNQGFSEIREYKFLKDRYYKNSQLTWPLSLTRNHSMDSYGISSYPAYILIDKQGIVRSGYYISHFSYLKQKITSLLKE